MIASSANWRPKWTVHNRSVIVVESKDDIRKRLGRSTDRADAVISAFFTSGSIPIPSMPPDPVMALLRHDPAAAYEAYWNDNPDTEGSIWHDQDPAHHRRQLLRAHRLVTRLSGSD